MSKKILSLILVFVMLLTSFVISSATTNVVAVLEPSTVQFPYEQKQLKELNLGESLGKIAGKGNTFTGMDIKYDDSSVTFTMRPGFINASLIDTIVINAANEYKVYYFPRALKAGDIVTVNTEGLGNNKNKLSQVGSIEFYHTNSGVITTYHFTIEAGPGGTVVNNGGMYAYEDEVNIEAVPESGFVFLKWVSSSGYIKNPENMRTTFIMPEEDARVMAVFAYENAYDTVDRELEKIKEINGGRIPDIFVEDESNIPVFIDGKYSNVIVTDYDSAIQSLHDIRALMLWHSILVALYTLSL